MKVKLKCEMLNLHFFWQTIATGKYKEDGWTQLRKSFIKPDFLKQVLHEAKHLLWIMYQILILVHYYQAVHIISWEYRELQ